MIEQTKIDADGFSKSYELIKRIYELRYEYLKHMTTMSVGSIGVEVAFLTSILDSYICVCLSILSLLAFFICLIGSLWGMPISVSIYDSMSKIQAYWSQPDEVARGFIREVLELRDKISKDTVHLQNYNRIVKYSFLFGVILFIVFIIGNI